MFGMGPWELALIFLVVLLLFGAKRLPDIAKGMGKGIKEFKKAVKDTQGEIKSSMKELETDDSDSNQENDKKDG
ncbi:MAG: twin-arginine translocase TatA/TatE family subunit [Candidatus Zixiibacteriota bacterium]|nr:MAG: twin-arginine translocase TatA/TatE family subunit [candidate division Zixibacteria bacterium]HHI02011.1 twin-arginine translocase TatA/TatE family subunit [candidate division Zixibacteria bacterium]